MRCLVGEVLYDFPSPNYGSPDQGLAYTEELIDRWKGDPLVSIMVEPHAPYTCSPDLLAAANELAVRRGVMLGLHLCESLTEIEEIQKRYGKAPVAHLEALGLLGGHLKVDHVVHVDGEDIGILADRGVKAVHNPESNMKLAAGIAPVPEMIAAGMTVGLGTDGCASNNNLDLLAEMDTAAKLHKVARQDPTEMKAGTVLRMATIEGARALGLDDRIGSLEAGKCADLIVLDTRQPHLTPLYNPISQIVYSAAGSDVRHTVIDGRVVMEDRDLKTLDLEAVLTAAVETRDRVLRWLEEA
jgi:5-methylthioadenosine/S-adenosylhomocysteine deaminase